MDYPKLVEQAYNQYAKSIPDKYRDDLRSTLMEQAWRYSHEAIQTVRLRLASKAKDVRRSVYRREENERRYKKKLRSTSTQSIIMRFDELREFVEKLPDRLAFIVHEFYYEGRTDVEIAISLSWSKTKVLRQRHRALAALKKEIQRVGGV